MLHAQIGILGLVCHGKNIILFLTPKHMKQIPITQCVDEQNTHQLPCKGLWKSVEVGYERCDVTSVSIYNLIEGKSYRLVVQRSPLKDKHGREQTDMFGVIYTYRCILTNNLTSTEKDIITFYNERGASEKNFDIQNNDFGWSHLPFSFMAENMVFMMVTAMLKNFYLYLVGHISDKVKPLKKTSRLKAFILHFVSVPAKWVRTGRQNVLNLYTNKAYYSEVFIE